MQHRRLLRVCPNQRTSINRIPNGDEFGWNPYFQNEKRSAEVHVIHEFPDDFYGADIRALVLGFIRPEQNYPSLGELIRDIKTDVEVAKHSLQRPAYNQLQYDSLFTTPS
ncbi:unnamed protein product [Absidia cylindrospora]